MVHSFLRAAVDALDDPVFTQVGVREPIDTEDSGIPVTPDTLVKLVGQLKPSEGARLISSSCVAAANLGHAYVHAFKLINYVETGYNLSMPSDEGEKLDRLFDKLPANTRSKLEAVYQNIKSHEFEMEEAFGEQPSSLADYEEGDGSSAFRRQLNYWQSNHLLQRAHEKYSEPGVPFCVRIIIPLRSVEVVDRILSDVLAPRLGLQYVRLTGQGKPQGQPKIEWKDATLIVTLPDNRGREISASWKPTVTSVVRIRPVGEQTWGVGFETPLNGCSFVGLEPGIEYEVKLTHKNEVGESEPAYMRVHSDPDHSPPA